MRIRTRLLLMLAPLIGLPVVVLTTLGLFSSQLASDSVESVANELRADALDAEEQAQAQQVKWRDIRREDLRQLTAEIADGLQRQVQSFAQLAQAVAAQPNLLQAAQPGQPACARLQPFVKQFRLSGLTVIDAAGKEVLHCSGMRSGPGIGTDVLVGNISKDESQSPWFTGLNSKEARVSTVIAPDPDLDAALALSVVAPVPAGNADQPVAHWLRLAVPLAVACKPAIRQMALHAVGGDIRVGGQLWVVDPRKERFLAVEGDGHGQWDLLGQDELVPGVSMRLGVEPNRLKEGGDLSDPVLKALQNASYRADVARAGVEDRWLSSTVVILVIVIVVIIGAMFAFWWFNRTLVHPIEKLAALSRRIAAGELDSSTRIQAVGEVADLANDFDTMRTNLRDQLQQLQQTNRELVQATKLKTQFLANMSHEIRTPMNGVIGMSELLAATDLQDDQRDLLGTLYRSAEATMAVIDDILDISKIEAGEMKLEHKPVDLRVLAEDTMRMVAEKAHSKGVDLIVRVDPALRCEVRADGNRLRQILLNLLSNAVKFTHKGSITTRIEIVDDSSGTMELRFSVQDTGVGISQEDQARLFRPFVQLDGSTTREFGGTGLGLAICKQLTQMMGSELKLHSALGKGSTFRFSIRLPRGKSVQQLPELQRLRILQVCDDDDKAAHVEDILQVYGGHSERARSLEAAEAMIEAAINEGRRFSLVCWDKAVFGDDPTCTLARADNPSDIPYHLLLTRVPDRQELPEMVIGCFDRVLSVPLRSTVLAECLLGLASHTSELIGDHSSDRAGRSGSDVRSLAGKVLLVEDNEVNQTVALRLLESMDLDVVVTGNGLQALAAMDRESFDLILMDCQMPHLDGFHTTQEIRMGEEGTDCHIPIVALTANAFDDDRRRCLDAGMDAYIAKPVKAETLYLVLRQFLRSGIRRRRVDVDTETEPEQV